ncbi:MAG: hypothetical protein EXQ94_09415 [Alphaproteobacteria bacterium]|nr:hypothetical protein [Alphaproteobacteria bacterium]
MARHRLAALLEPASLAVVGASGREGSHGFEVVAVTRHSGYRGDLWGVNPRHDRAGDVACFPDFAALPAPPEHAVLAVGAARLEAALDEALAAGVRAFTIFDQGHIAGEAAPTLLDRLRAKAKAAGALVCGGNGMGFCNFAKGCCIGFQGPDRMEVGGITFLTHSGSVFVMALNNDPRYRFNLAVSCGQEIAGTVADYMDYALDLPSTRVIALFIETVRDPTGFAAVLARAATQGIPVVVAKMGRTALSARLAQVHSGAEVGDDSAFDELCRRHGAIRVASLDELMATSLVLGLAPLPAAGGLGMVLDSGGLREMYVDLAASLGVPLAEVSAASLARMTAVLPPALRADNPMDAAGPLDESFIAVFRTCLLAIAEDPAVGLVALEIEARDHFEYQPSLRDLVKEVRAATPKPLVVTNAMAGANNRAIAADFAAAGIPLVNGAELALRAIRAAFAFRDRRS